MSTLKKQDLAHDRYHHGNLREALLAAGRDILAREGVTALTLRAVARRAGVSATAPYRHFADKAALLAAIAADGFRGLAAAMRDAAAGIAEPRERMAAIGRAYVVYAVGNSAVMRLMFGPEIADKSAHPELRDAGADAFGVLAGELVAAGDGAGSPAALAAWSLVHGLATLLIDNQVDPQKLGLDTLDPGTLADRVGRFLAISPSGAAARAACSG